MTDTDTLFRSFEPDLEVRKGGDGRTVTGIAVPYGKPQRIHEALTEQFATGAFRAQMRAANRVAFARDHLQLGGTLIGRLDVMEDVASGLRIEARVAKTVAGDETLALIDEGALRELSIGFRVRQDRTLPDGTVERVKAELREVAVVLEGAYGRGATIGQVRAEDQQRGGCSCGGCTCTPARTSQQQTEQQREPGQIARATLRETEALLSGLPERLPL